MPADSVFIIQDTDDTLSSLLLPPQDLTGPSSPTGSGYKTAGSAVGSMTPPNNHPASVEATWNNPYSAASYSSGYAPMPTLYYHSQYCPHYGGWDIHGTPVTCMQYPSIYPHPVYAPYGYFTAPIPAYVVTPPMPPTPQSQLGASQLSTSFHSVESSGNGGSQNGTRGGKKGRIPCGQCHEERIKYSGEVRAFKGMSHCCYPELPSVLNLFFVRSHRGND